MQIWNKDLFCIMLNYVMNQLLLIMTALKSFRKKLLKNGEYWKNVILWKLGRTLYFWRWEEHFIILKMGKRLCYWNWEERYIIEAEGYVPENDFNADETGLLWKKIRTFFLKQIAQLQVVKQPKITSLFYYVQISPEILK